MGESSAQLLCKRDTKVRIGNVIMVKFRKGTTYTGFHNDLDDGLGMDVVDNQGEVHVWSKDEVEELFEIQSVHIGPFTATYLSIPFTRSWKEPICLEDNPDHKMLRRYYLFRGTLGGISLSILALLGLVLFL